MQHPCLLHSASSWFSTLSPKDVRCMHCKMLLTLVLHLHCIGLPATLSITLVHSSCPLTYSAHWQLCLVPQTCVMHADAHAFQQHNLGNTWTAVITLPSCSGMLRLSATQCLQCFAFTAQAPQYSEPYPSSKTTERVYVQCVMATSTPLPILPSSRLLPHTDLQPS